MIFIFVARSKERREELPLRGKMTRRITEAYYESMWVRTSRFHKFRFNIVLQSLTEAQEMQFRKASHQCSRLGALYQDYIDSQFNVFDTVSDIKQKSILPMPHHLHGDNAARRYINRNDGTRHRQTEADLIMRAKRNIPFSDGNVFDVQEVQKQFFRDQRKLESLSMMLKISPKRVLDQYPAQFSPEFISYRTVVAAA